MAPWDIHYGGQPGSPCGAVKRGPAQFQVALPIETQVYNSRKVAGCGSILTAGHIRAPPLAWYVKPGGVQGGSGDRSGASEIKNSQRRAEKSTLFCL